MTKIPVLTNIKSLDLINQKNGINKRDKTQNGVSVPSFGDTVTGFLNGVNESSKTASAKVAEVVQGKSEDIASAMTALEESKVNFQLMLEIRNKLLDAYKEIERMQI